MSGALQSVFLLLLGAALALTGAKRQWDVFGVLLAAASVQLGGQVATVCGGGGCGQAVGLWGRDALGLARGCGVGWWTTPPAHLHPARRRREGGAHASASIRHGLIRGVRAWAYRGVRLCGLSAGRHAPTDARTAHCSRVGAPGAGRAGGKTGGRARLQPSRA